MCISNTNSCSSWEPYGTSKSWTLPAGDGVKTVWAIFKDNAGNASAMYPHSITLETTGPTGSVVINDGAAYANSASVTLKLASPGATQMCIRNNTFASCAFLWEPYSSTKAWTFPSGDGTKTVYVEYQDGAGKVSALYSDSYRPWIPVLPPVPWRSMAARLMLPPPR